ncbi:hypothetical protein Ade02nite_20500 [Paractinoplanes deccanensis]|uniref:GIY-YIG domain-containing protein n=1 Tax=Paractinoplanes deccanensis TaxID=113561 RepID=A0ABQ3Y098_9ACTN|nr:hypothetical protein [Actinoplanes deccanensis]GID73409.1 hypothetical protein Ade02nite_20500 [Actinoplanes deccanensis]
MTITTTERATALYRLFGVDGALLYVGVTFDPPARFQRHSERKEWWPEVDQSKVSIDWYPDRVSAEVAELRVIRDENPRYNVVTADADGRPTFRPRGDGLAWGRPSHEPDDQQAKVLRALANLAEQRRIIDEQADKLIARAKELDVPIEHIAVAAGRTRKTVYRHLGKPMK